MMTLSSSRSAAFIAGISLVIMAIVAGFAYGYVFNTLIVQDNAMETTKRITENNGLYLSGALAWVVVLILDIIVSLALFRFFKETDNRLSKISMLLRLLYSFLLALGIIYLFRVPNSLNSALIEVQHFQLIWSIGLVVFGLHLIALGILAYRSVDVPKLWGILLLLAGVSYVIIHLSKLIFGGRISIELLENILSLPMIVGELGFAIWLLIYAAKKS